MITIIYHVPVEQKDAELEWLRDQKIFPAVQVSWDWEKGGLSAVFACIVSPTAATTIKLRHPKLDIQIGYKQR